MSYLASATELIRPAMKMVIDNPESLPAATATLLGTAGAICLAKYAVPTVVSAATSGAKSSVAFAKTISDKYNIAPWKGLTGGAVGVLGVVAAGVFSYPAISAATSLYVATAAAYPTITIVASAVIGATGLYYASTAAPSERLKDFHLEAEIDLLNPSLDTRTEAKKALAEIENIDRSRSLRETVDSLALDPAHRAKALTILSKCPDHKDFVEKFKKLNPALTSREKLSLLEAFAEKFPSSSQWSSTTDQLLNFTRNSQKTFRIYADLLTSLSANQDQIIPSSFNLPIDQIGPACSALRKLPAEEQKGFINSIDSFSIPNKHILETIELITDINDKETRNDFIKFVKEHIYGQNPLLLTPGCLKILKNYKIEAEFKKFSTYAIQITEGINNEKEIEETLKHLHSISEDKREQYIEAVKQHQKNYNISRFQAVVMITGSFIAAPQPPVINGLLERELKTNKEDLSKFLDPSGKYLTETELEEITKNARKNGGVSQLIKDAESHFSFRMDPQNRVQMAKHLAQIPSAGRQAAKKLTSPFASPEGKLKIIDAFQRFEIQNLDTLDQFCKDADKLIFHWMGSDLRTMIIEELIELTPQERKDLSETADLLSKNKKTAGTTFLEQKSMILSRRPAPPVP